MTSSKDPVSVRYAEAFFSLVKQAGQVDAVAAEFAALAELIRGHAQLRALLLNPDVEAEDKLGVLDRLMGGWSAELRAFVRMAIEFDRVAFLVEMSEAFGELVDAQRRVVRATVRSAHPLSVEMCSRLVEWLEGRERATVALTEEVDPGLLGGVQIFLGHRTLDGSVRTQLSTLKQRLKRIRVH